MLASYASWTSSSRVTMPVGRSDSSRHSSLSQRVWSSMVVEPPSIASPSAVVRCIGLVASWVSSTGTSPFRYRDTSAPLSTRAFTRLDLPLMVTHRDNTNRVGFDPLPSALKTLASSRTLGGFSWRYSPAVRVGSPLGCLASSGGGGLWLP